MLLCHAVKRSHQISSHMFPVMTVTNQGIMSTAEEPILVIGTFSKNKTRTALTKRLTHRPRTSAAAQPQNSHGRLSAVLLFQDALHIRRSLASGQASALTGGNLRCECQSQHATHVACLVANESTCQTVKARVNALVGHSRQRHSVHSWLPCCTQRDKAASLTKASAQYLVGHDEKQQLHLL